MAVKEFNQKLTSYLIPITLILGPFRLFGSFYNVGLLILLVYAVFSIAFMGNSIRLPKSLFIFILSYLGMYFLNNIRNAGESLNILNFIIGSVLSLFYLSSLIGGFNYSKFYKVYKCICLIVSSVLIVQALGLFIFDIPAVPINILPVAEVDYNYWDFFKGERPSGFFSEPQAFCSFVIPFLIFSLYRKEFLSSGLVLFAILLSTSTLGLAIAAIVILHYLSVGKKMSTTTKLGVLLGVGGVVAILISYGLLDYSIQKLMATPLENNIRMVRGFYIYSKFSTMDLLFGISYDLEAYVLKNIHEAWVSLYIEAGLKNYLGYTTSMSGLLIQFGIIPLALYLVFLKDCFKSGSEEIKTLVIITFVLGFVQTIVFNTWFIFYIAIILGSNYEKGQMKFISFK